MYVAYPSAAGSWSHAVRRRSGEAATAQDLGAPGDDADRGNEIRAEDRLDVPAGPLHLSVSAVAALT